MAVWFSEADVRAQLVELGYPDDMTDDVLKPFMRGRSRGVFLRQ